ncbi:MAG: threonine dehydratase, biosynthetic [Candidatus Saccharibacteria bacterium]|nr:threonine dehydratase, biosynthetic [Candidatus Saccharibacteria bacterium]
MSPLLIDDIVRAILTSRVYDVAIESPLERAQKISFQTGRDVYLKREDLQPVHSFKLRGAYNKIAQLTASERASGVIAASAGNHGQGVALAAQKLGISALVVMPRTTPAIKIDAVRSYGGEVELAGDSYSEAADYCKVRAKETKRTFIHPFDDPLVIAGQGTIGREIVEQLPAATHIFVPIGGGGLIAGIASYVKALRPDILVIGVEPEDSNSMQISIAKEERIVLKHVGIFADGVAVKQVGVNTFPIAMNKVDDFITVSTDQMCSAIKSIFEDTRSIVEPAGALAVAGIANYNLPKNAVPVAICSGANMTFERLQQVAERTLFGSGREALFAVTLGEKPGTLHGFCSEIVRTRNITELSYRKDQRANARILVGVTVENTADKQTLMNKMTNHEYAHMDLSGDETTKEHVRHMIGGQPHEKVKEYLYEVTFPERPGALIDFLDAVGDLWNISLFHYRSAASDSGRVLIGFETDARKNLEAKLENANFEWTRSDKNAGVAAFL